MTLLDALDAVPDPRRPQGRRYPLPPLLAAVVMAMLSGHHGYRAIGRFLRANDRDLRRRLPFGRDVLPSHVTVRAVLQAIDPTALADAFTAWAAPRLPPGPDIALDAKAIRSTVTDHDGSGGGAGQDFAAVVSAYAARTGLVVGAEPYANGHTSEIAAAQRLIDRLADALDLTGATVTLDALHAVKKRSARSRRPGPTGS